MKIQQVQIKSYRSLRNVMLDELNRLIVLVGANGSGKTNVLEALSLFFDNFDMIGGTPPPLDDYAWHLRNTIVPIEFIVTLKLEEKECKEIFPAAILKIVKEREKYDGLNICRQIPKPGAAWRTEYIKWADLYLVKDGKQITLDELNRSLAPKPPPKKEEVRPPPKIPEAPKEEKEVKEKSSSKPQNPSSAITQEMLTKMNENLVSKIKGCFKTISAARDVKAIIGKRETFVDPGILKEIYQLSQSLGLEEEAKFYELMNTYYDFFLKSLEPAGGIVRIREGPIRYQVHSMGGGEQEVLCLIYSILKMKKDAICAIEEPELHLHPRLSKKLFGFLKRVSQRNQIWVATHSSLFLDRADNNNWTLWIEGGETKVERRPLKECLNTLGASPSDRLFPESIFMVEGRTEEKAIPILAKTKGLDFSFVKIMSFEGTKDRPMVQACEEILRDTQASLFLMVDQNKEPDVEYLIERGFVKSQNSLVLRGTFEDYYPVEVNGKALVELYGLKPEDVKIDPKRRRVDEIKRILGKSNKSDLLPDKWKVEVGEKVARLMKKGDIDKNINEMLERVAKGGA